LIQLLVVSSGNLAVIIIILNKSGIITEPETIVCLKICKNYIYLCQPSKRCAEYECKISHVRTTKLARCDQIQRPLECVDPTNYTLYIRKPLQRDIYLKTYPTSYRRGGVSNLNKFMGPLTVQLTPRIFRLNFQKKKVPTFFTANS